MRDTTKTSKPAETPQALPRIAFASAGAMTPQARRRTQLDQGIARSLDASMERIDQRLAELARAEQPKLSAAGEIVRGLRPADHD